jgi:hypothetical protein
MILSRKARRLDDEGCRSEEARNRAREGRPELLAVLRHAAEIDRRHDRGRVRAAIEAGELDHPIGRRDLGERSVDRVARHALEQAGSRSREERCDEHQTGDSD